MNTQRIIGDITKFFGIVFLIFTAIIFIRTASDNSGIKLLTIFGVLGLVFLISGLTLSRTAQPKADFKEVR